jgi:hypothetical protein
MVHTYGVKDSKLNLFTQILSALLCFDPCNPYGSYLLILVIMLWKNCTHLFTKFN